MQVFKNIIIPGANGLSITLDLCFEPGITQKPVVLYAHGFNGFKDWGNFDLVANKFAKAGFVFVKFNFSHNGTTTQHPDEFADLDAFGKNNYTIELADLKTVVDWISNSINPYHNSMDTDRLFLIGHSMGAGIATIFAAEDYRIKKLVLWAGITDCKTPWGDWPEARLREWKITGVQYCANTRTNQQMPLYYQLYLDYQIHHQRLNIKKSIAQLQIPVLICHGSSDISVPVEKAYELKECQPAAELFIIDSNHVFDRRHPWIMTYLPEAMEEVTNKTINFFLELKHSVTLAPRL